MVFETDQRGGSQTLDLRVDNDVSDEAFLAGLGFHINEADAGEALALGGLVVVAKELIAAADGEHRSACLHSTLERRLFVLEKVLVHKRLLAILATSEEEDVHVLHVLGGAASELQQLCVVIAPLRPLEQSEDVAAIAIDVHQVGIEPPNGEGLLSTWHLGSLEPPTFPNRVWPSPAERARLVDRASQCRCLEGGQFPPLVWL